MPATTLVRPIQTRFLTILTLALAAATAPPAPPTFAAPAAAIVPLATVTTLQGHLTLTRKGSSKAVDLAERSSLAEGDVVKTPAGSKATLLFADGSQVRLNANTTVVISRKLAVGKGK